MNIGILIPATLPQVIVEVVKVMEIGLLRHTTLPQVISEVVDVGQVRPAITPIVITKDMLIDFDISHKRPSTLTLDIMEQELMFKVEVDMGLRPATITSLTKVNMAD